MKKVLTILLLMMYTLTTAGAVMEWHYCMGRLESVEMGLDEEHTCKRCGMEIGQSNCCKDEVVVAKISDSHQATPWQTQPEPLVLVLPSPRFTISDINAQDLDLDLAAGNNSPPPLQRRHQSMLCVFRC